MPETQKTTSSYDSFQMELPLFKRGRGRPYCKADWRDLKRALDDIKDSKLRCSNIDGICQKLGVHRRTAYRLWKDLKSRFEQNAKPLSNWYARHLRYFWIYSENYLKGFFGCFWNKSKWIFSKRVKFRILCEKKNLGKFSIYRQLRDFSYTENFFEKNAFELFQKIKFRLPVYLLCNNTYYPLRG